MIASTALEVLLIGLAIWQLVVVRRSLRADREQAERERTHPAVSESDQDARPAAVPPR